MHTLRTLRRLVFAALPMIAVGCGDAPEPDPKARDAAEWVLRRGGTVRLGATPGKISEIDRLPPGDFGLEEIDLNSLPVDQPPIRDNELKVLDGLTNLRSLGLYGSDLTDRGAETIAGLRSLRQLELSQTQLTDRGLETLSALPNIETLFLRNVGDKVTDDGVKSFERRTGGRVFR